VEEGLRLAESDGEEEVFIIGGGEIYQQTMHLLDRLYLTEVDLDTEGAVFFPKINPAEWDLVSEVKHQKDEKNEWNYTFKVFERKKS
jgi:dihydrofolate reductase